MSHRLNCAGFSVSLTSDAYEYNDRFFTLEVTETAEDGENDADHSGLPIDAEEKEIQRYLEGAADCVRQLYDVDGSIRRTAANAAAAGHKAIIRLRSEQIVDGVTSSISALTGNPPETPVRQRSGFSPL